MKRLLISAAMFLCCVATSFAQFSGSGSGTESDPYLILNPIQLNQMRNFLNQEGVYFKLMANIDLAGFLEDENPEQGWQPVGQTSAPFKGFLDGNGKTISGLWINRSSSDYVGLFGCTNGATIKNLTLSCKSVKGNTYVGVLSAHSTSTTISDCTLSGSVIGTSYVGGCIGWGKSNVISCVFSTVEVTCNGNYAGGLIGYSEGSHSIAGNRVECNSINGGDYIGGICGSYKKGYRCYFHDNYVQTSILGNDYVGGICGEYLCSNGDDVCICVFVGTIIAHSQVGGIFGYSAITSYNGVLSIKSCSTICHIVASGENSGGLLGTTNYFETSPYAYGVSLSESYSNGTIKGNNNVGGVIGYARCGIVTKCYSHMDVTGNKFIGGLLGKIEGYSYYGKLTVNSSISMSTYLNATEGYVGRIYGNKGNFVTIGEMGTSEENKSYNRTIVINAGVAQDVTDDEQNGTGVSATTLKLKATYVAMGWDFTDMWDIQETECFPYFKTQTAPPVITSQVISGATTVSGKCVDGGTVTLEIDGVKQQMVSTGNTFSFTVSPLQAGHEVRVCAKADDKEQSYYTTEVVSFIGKGTEADPYQISTAADLTQVYRKGYYKLMNDIDLTSYINQFSPSEGWQSIGRDGSETIHFDGDGHKITGLWCNSTRDNTGLFSCFANGYIKNITVETTNGKQVKGGANTGILIGKMINGTIENCRVSGSLSDGTPVGGIVGLMDNGNILKCQADVTINTTVETSYVGGLVGEITAGEINQCYTKGTLTAKGSESYVGGLVGKNSSTITNCHSSAAIHSSYNAAGLIAYNYSVVEKSYATGNLFSNNYAAGVIGYNDGANAVVRNCAAMNNKIDVIYESQQGQQGGGYGQRVIGGIKNSAPAPDLNNYALKTMQVSVNDVTQKVYDDIMNGVAKTNEELTNANTYEGMGWDFTNVWKMLEEAGYPVLQVGSYEGTEGGNTPGGDDPQTESFSASSVKVMTGKQQEVNIALDNESEIIMVEFELQLPNGITIAKDEDDEFLTELVGSRVTKSHILEVADKGNGKYKFLLYSSSNTPIKGNSGDLIKFTINCDKNVAEGTYQAKANNILLADKNEKAIYPSDFTIDITVVDAIPGDVNGDDKINGLDIVKIVGYIMGSPTQPFIEAAADLTEDGVINGLDLVKEVSLVMAQSSEVSSGAKATGRQRLSMASQLTLENKEKGVVTLGVDDNRAFILSQMFVETSGDVTIKDITTDANHIVAYRRVSENRYTMVCYSMTNEAFANNSNIIDIHYTGHGGINVANALFIDSGENEVSLGNAYMSNTTAIKGVDISDMQPTDIYTVSGKLVKKGATSLVGLPAGIYLVNGQKIIIK